MAKTWILDTGTKGTGASVRPLEDAKGQSASSGDGLAVVHLKRPAKPRPERRPRPGRRFKIVDVVTRETLAEGVDTRVALRVLRDDVRHNMDVHVYVHVPESDTWRLLSMGEQRALWDARDRAARAS